MPAGRLMLDLVGTEIAPRERELLAHPEVGGLILFTRNYSSQAQLKALVDDIRSIAPDILIAVDHEGGRVQRFRDGFVRIPPMAAVARLWQQDQAAGCAAAKELAWLMAIELTQLDIDISFAPVLDLDWGRSEIIGDRAFGDNPEQVIALTTAFIAGMKEAGMASTGKHFPGHGWVVADSHLDIPRDERSLEQLRGADLVPFGALVDAGMEAVMPAHVIYEQVDQNTAGFSQFWLQEVLRGEMGFDGVIFSDDLTMEGARVAGDYPSRAKAALEAGCDMVLVCNNPEAAVEVLDYLQDNPDASPASRIARMRYQPALAVKDESRYRRAKAIAASLLD